MTITRLPGSPTIFLHSLYSTFLWIRGNVTAKHDVTIMSLSQWVRENLGWENSSVHAARFIGATFLTMTSRQTLHLSEWALNWFAIEDDTIRAELLYEYLDDRIFFFGDILELLHTPKNSNDLLDKVISMYPNVKWHTPGLLSSRLDWLMACGKVHKLKSVILFVTDR